MTARRRGSAAARASVVGLVLLAAAAAAKDAAKPPPKAVPSPGGFAALLHESLTGRSFAQSPDTADPAAKPMFDRLTAGDYKAPPLEALPDLARLDHLVTEACPTLKTPSQLVKDSTPFLLTGKFDAKTVPPGLRVVASDPAALRLDLPTGRFLIYSLVLTGVRIAPAPVREARGIELGACRASGDALSLVDGTTTDATIAGQGLTVIGGDPVWVVVARVDKRVGINLQPLDRRLKNYQVGDGWKFLSAP
jgi:hypothetical protein